MDDRPDLSPVIEAHASLAELLRSLLSEDEQEQIKQQFDRQCRRDAQVMWSGVPRQVAQAWADKRNLQTLTTAMGPLMDKHDPSCLKPKKSQQEWSTYIKGASALFACHITRSSKVTVLSRPPPQKLNPSGQSNYQLFEEPILKGTIGGSSVGCIQMVHPTVMGAEEQSYQSWPVDRTEQWTEKFPHPAVARIRSRKAKLHTETQCLIAIVSIAEKGESVASLPHQDSAILNPQSRNETQIAMKKKAKEEKKRKVREKKEKRKIAKKEKKAREEMAKKKKANEEKERKARDEKAKKKKENEEKERKAREEKAKRKKENEEKQRKAREKKAKKKKANDEKERKARDEKEKNKRANEEREKKARDEKAKKMKANEEKERKARDEKEKKKTEKAKKRREKKAKKKEKARRKREKAKRKRARMMQAGQPSAVPS